MNAPLSINSSHADCRPERSFFVLRPRVRPLGRNDDLSGGDSNDRLEGGIMLGGEDADDMEGGSGDDVMNGGTGDDIMDGGIGNDTYYVESGPPLQPTDLPSLLPNK
jgi:hypothetical protein